MSVTSRALALLAGIASPVFMVAAVAGWLTGLWPANPLTLGVAAVLVVMGPLLGIVHVATADEDGDELEVAFATTAVAIAPDTLITPRAASARAFHNWRET